MEATATWTRFFCKRLRKCKILKSLMQVFSCFITSAEAGGMQVFSLSLVYLSVNKITQKLIDRCSWNFVEVKCVPGTNRLDFFWNDPDPGLDTGAILPFLQHGEIGHFMTSSNITQKAVDRFSQNFRRVDAVQGTIYYILGLIRIRIWIHQNQFFHFPALRDRRTFLNFKYDYLKTCT